MVCLEGVYEPCLGVLGVPLITVPDKGYLQFFITGYIFS
jgi:hypothetical protein